MQFSTILTFVAALMVGQSIASPDLLQKRTTCQACAVGGYEAGPACCSAHVWLFPSQKNPWSLDECWSFFISALPRATFTVDTVTMTSKSSPPPLFIFSFLPSREVLANYWRLSIASVSATKGVARWTLDFVDANGVNRKEDCLEMSFRHPNVLIYRGYSWWMSRVI